MLFTKMQEKDSECLFDLAIPLFDAVQAGAVHGDLVVDTVGLEQSC